ncbi:YkyA family protein [Salicibibacter cibarius]|uniref:YkyA family protein n=1 Tax=Salicibibacter cibarius TaxID=2743000 RepID=A0A7T7CCC1_9BACI|nr:YkyA family protein [Salicibibacter cibarius]QQK76844.1 YkyA family protein [Salicibibacter cibarius]
MKRWVQTAAITIGAVSLAGCSESVGIEDATSSVAEIENQKDNVIAYINEILAQEEEMLEGFEEDLAENEAELFSAREAQVFANLEERESHLAAINDSAQAMQMENDIIATVLEDGDSEELPMDELEQLNEQTASLHNELNEFVETYGSELQTQDDYFSGLGEDSDFEFLADGIETVNEAQEDVHELLESIHDELLTTEAALEDVEISEEASS